MSKYDFLSSFTCKCDNSGCGNKDAGMLNPEDITLIYNKGTGKYFSRFQCPETSCQGIRGINLCDVVPRVVRALLNQEVQTIEINSDSLRLDEGMPRLFDEKMTFEEVINTSVALGRLTSEAFLAELQV